jgi:hypothetical protein
MARRQTPPAGAFLTSVCLRRFEDFVLKVLGPAAKGKGRWRVRYIEEESGPPNNEGDGGYAFYATDWLRPQTGQFFGRMASAYRVELLVWSPEPGHWWKGQMRVTWRASAGWEFLGERGWMHVWYRPGDGRWATELEYSANQNRSESDFRKQVREALATMRKQKGAKK